ncbi:Succinate dehydrogenase cytochrome B subunit, mitochondrial 2 [Colletotrichum chlorophyti]|uniref:Succinate dehydrogenase cytochrome B subunit, mitochondrial 2 n=1 Tax=Colletotrichum chlorophyti TaxID=708187 RepID=A0A1Q8S0M6_9PEZI|nr:Succinate dehydrogenase cytochrome B subunit, mitochondrial 2 [Colletotrichum chlorophyti]
MTTTQIRPVATSKVTTNQGSNEILAKQRLSRPISPHLRIYKFEQTWFNGSVWNRITGSAMSAVFYIYFGTYLAAPLLGWHVEAASLISAFGALSPPLKGFIKFFMAWPFTYHLLNGIRHLTYDLGFGFAKYAIAKWAWIVWTSSLLSALGLTFAW